MLKTNNINPKRNSIINKVFLGLFLIIIILLLLFFVLSKIYLAPVNKKDNSQVNFTIESGWGKNKIADELEKNNLIKSSIFFKFYIRLNISKEFYAGTYLISKNMSVPEIIALINSGKSLENETITITFIEGKRLTNYVKQISTNFGFPETEIMAKLTDTVYLNKLIQQYWFITSDILKTDIYYPLEGYLFPDTYIFKKNSTIEEIINKMLNNMNDKISAYKDVINLSSYNIHELLTLSSIVELEGASSNDRAGIAQVFYNRLTSKITLGSDVTTYYAANKTFDKDLTKNELNSCNAYNTRGTCVPGLPIGPIASPSLASIAATVEPEDNSYYFFVTDKFGQTYFNKTNAEHESTVASLKKAGKWFEY